MRSSLRAVFVALVLSLLACAPAHGQDTDPRFGFGFHLLGSTAEGSIGPGVRFRVSAPITPDVSFAVGAEHLGIDVAPAIAQHLIVVVPVALAPGVREVGLGVDDLLAIVARRAGDRPDCR